MYPVKPNLTFYSQNNNQKQTQQRLYKTVTVEPLAVILTI